MSGFGLSAFLFSVVAHTFFRNVSSLLLLLCFGTSFPMIIGFLFIRAIPLPTSELMDNTDYPVHEIESGRVSHLNEDDSHMPLLSHEDGDEVDAEHAPSQPSQRVTRQPLTSPEVPTDELQLNLTRSFPPRTWREAQPDIYRKMLWTSTDFWILFVTLSLCAFFSYKPSPSP
jgi:hypothetical protein